MVRPHEAFPVVAATAAIFLLVVLFSLRNESPALRGGLGGGVVENPTVIIEGLSDVCHYDDPDCLSSLSPTPMARSLSPRMLPLANEMEYLERDTFNPNIKRLYRFQGGCGFQHVRDTGGKFITMWPHLVGEDGVLIDDVCAPGDPIRISLNASAINATGGGLTAISTSCGLAASVSGTTADIELLLQGSGGIGVDDACMPGAPVQLTFVPGDVDIAAVLASWFGAHCGVQITQDVDGLAFSLLQTGLNGIGITDGCPGDATVQFAFVPADVDFPAAYTEWFEEGCGIASAVSGGNIELSVAATGANGVAVDPMCGPGDPLALSFVPADVDFPAAYAEWFDEGCAIASAVSGGNIELSVVASGTNGVAVDPMCGPGDPLALSFVPADVDFPAAYAEWFEEGCGIDGTVMGGNVELAVVATGANGVVVDPMCGPGDPLALSFVPTQMNMTEAAPVWFGESCGTTIDASSGVAVFGLNVTGGAGVIVTGGCAPGDALLIEWDPNSVNVSDLIDAVFIGSCGLDAMPINSTALALTINATGENGVLVDDICAPGDALVLRWDPTLVNLTQLVPAWFANTCGFVFDESGGFITGTPQLQGANGMTVDDSCAPGGDIVLSWDPAFVNLTQLAPAWFADTCGFVFQESGGFITGTPQLQGTNGMTVDDSCAPGGDIVLSWDPALVNLTQLAPAWFTDTCGFVFQESGGFITGTPQLQGFNGMVVDDLCAPGGDIELSWDPELVNATAVAAAWFVDGCGATVSAVGGDIQVAANVAPGPGIGVTPFCFPGDPLQLYFEPETVNVTEFVDVLFGASCGLTVAESGGEIVLAADLVGQNGIVINDTCVGSAVFIAWDPSEVNLTELTALWFESGCGMSVTEAGGVITIAANVIPGPGIGVAPDCDPGDPLQLYFEPETVNVTEFVDVLFGATCGLTVAESGGEIVVASDLAGLNGITVDQACAMDSTVFVSWDPALVNATAIAEQWFVSGCGSTVSSLGGDILVESNVIPGPGIGVEPGCGLGDPLQLYLDPSTANVTAIVEQWFVSGCGVTVSESGGDILVESNVVPGPGIGVEPGCGLGDPLQLYLDPSTANVTAIVEQWFVSGCGTTVSESGGDILVESNVIPGPGIGIEPGCGLGDPLQLFWDPSTANVSELVDVLFGASCGLTVNETGGEVLLATDLLGLNGITVNQACLMGTTAFIEWDPALVNATAVVEQWFVSGCGASVSPLGGDILVESNVIPGPGIGVEPGCGLGDPLQLYLDPSTANVTAIVEQWFVSGCGATVSESGGDILVEANVIPGPGIGVEPGCGLGDPLQLYLDPSTANVTALDAVWFRDTCGTQHVVSGGAIGFELNITGDQYILVDQICPAGDAIQLSLNVSALNIPDIDLGGTCLVFGNASLAPAAELVQTEGLLLSRIIAEEPCSNRRTHFYIDLPHAPLGFGMLVGKDNAFTGSGVRSSAVLGGEAITVAGGSQYVTVLNGLSHVVNIAGDYGFIAGGLANQLDDDENFIGVARNSRIYDQGTRSTILGGDANAIGPFTTAHTHMLIGQGSGNVNKASYGVILGGLGNTVEDGLGPTSLYATVINGQSNLVRGRNSIIGTGTNNLNEGTISAIVTGNLNYMTPTALHAVIAGGQYHTINADSAGILAGYGCTIFINGVNSWIGGGLNNQVTAARGFVLGGNNNVVNAVGSGIAAGRNHVVGALAERSIILAGDGVVLSAALDADTAATQHLLAVGGFRTSGIATSNAATYNLAYGSFFYLMSGNSATIRLPTTMPEGTQFIVRNNHASSAATVSCVTNSCTFCDQGSACTVGGTKALAARTSVRLLFIGNNYYVI